MKTLRPLDDDQMSLMRAALSDKEITRFDELVGKSLNLSEMTTLRQEEAVELEGLLQKLEKVFDLPN